MQPSFNTLTKAQGMPASEPLVPMYCAACYHVKHVPMNTFWAKRNDVSRTGPTCTNCRKEKRIREWLRHLHTVGSTIKQWLQYNNATELRLPHMTTELYLHQEISEPQVPIYCPRCGVSKDFDLNKLWRKSKEINRYPTTKCNSCKEFSKLGNWRRKPNEADNTIDRWMACNDALNKDEGRPQHMTVELYLRQTLPDALKRKAHTDAASKSQKHRRTR